MQEQTIFRKGSVQVTRSRVVIGGQTYQLNGVTTIRTATKPVKHSTSVLMGSLGILALIFGVYMMAVLCLGIAVFLWIRAKPTYYVYFGSGDCEQQILSSHDTDYVGRIFKAIGEAMS